jgi:hypothetical protein
LLVFRRYAFVRIFLSDFGGIIVMEKLGGKSVIFRRSVPCQYFRLAFRRTIGMRIGRAIRTPISAARVSRLAGVQFQRPMALKNKAMPGAMELAAGRGCQEATARQCGSDELDPQLGRNGTIYPI